MDEEVEIILQQDSVDVTEPLVADYILPTATASTLGGVKIGDNINIDSAGHISVPIASGSTAGVVKVGTGLSISAEGVLSSSGGYVLPQATKTTLGGVYVDDELSTESINPVQNAVVSLELDSLSSTVDGLDTTVSGLDDTVDTLSGTVSGISSTVGTLDNSVTTLSNSVDTLSSSVSSQTSSIGTLTNDVTNLQTGLGETSQHVSDLMLAEDLVLSYGDITTGTWTAGDLSIVRRGATGCIICNLEGSLTIPANDSVVLYDLDTPLEYSTMGVMTDGTGIVETMTNTAGEFIIMNNTASSITITKIMGTLPIIYAEE